MASKGNDCFVGLTLDSTVKMLKQSLLADISHRWLSCHRDFDVVPVGVTKEDLLDSASVDLLAEGYSMFVQEALYDLDVVLGHGECEMIRSCVNDSIRFRCQIQVLDDVNLYVIVVKPSTAKTERRTR